MKRPSAADDDAEVPGFTLHEVIGRGGMGIVFRATRSSDGVTVAVKLLPSHLVDDDEVAERFAREAQALAALDHPHVLRVLDSGITMDGRLFIVTEFAAGGDLAKRLQRGPLTVDEVRRMFNEVLAAVGEAHRQGIVHRDIKPANILLDERGSVRVADFSLAKLLREGAGPQLTLTQSADVFGTPYYIAPEVRRGAGSADERSDIFSLGVLLHEVLTGRVPMGSYERASTLAMVPAEVDRLIERCLGEDPKKRPQSIAELQQAFASLWSTNVWLWIGVFALAAMLVLGLSHFWQPVKLPAVDNNVAASSFTNGFGMKFVSVPGTRVQFCIWETRRSDFARYADESKSPLAQQELLRRPIGKVTRDDPITPVSLSQAMKFCQWLTEVEHQKRLISPLARYRLPTNEEWDAAAKGTAFQNNANLAGDEVRPGRLDYRDNFIFTAPVGSFAPNAQGLFDIIGNVSEWCIGPPGSRDARGLLRGGSWDDSDAVKIDANHRELPATDSPAGSGFRIVLDPGT